MLKRPNGKEKEIINRTVTVGLLKHFSGVVWLWWDGMEAFQLEFTLWMADGRLASGSVTCHCFERQQEDLSWMRYIGESQKEREL